MLRQLVEYASRLDLPPPLYSETPLRYVIALDSTGRPLSRQPIDTADRATWATERGIRHLAPVVRRTSVIRPLLLADQSEYTFGLARPGSKGDRPLRCHAAYLALVRRCAVATADHAVTAVDRFLNEEPLTQLDLPADFDPGATVTFQVDGQFVIDRPAVRQFWAAMNDPAAHDAPTMQCLVCSQPRPVLRRMQANIKGIPSGNAAGTSLISADKSAFSSYGLDASLIAPTCSSCAQAFTHGLNDLLGQRVHHVVLGHTAFVFWTDPDVAFPVRALLEAAQPDDVRPLLETCCPGEGSLPNDVRFYGVMLTANNSRAVVRGWIDTPLAEVKAALAAWFDDQAIVDREGRAVRPLGLHALAASMVRDVAGDLTPSTVRSLLLAALTGSGASLDLLATALRRNRAEGGVTHSRAALIKLALIRQKGRRSELQQLTRLAINHPSSAYQAGRLLATLHAVHWAALGGADSTVIDRYYPTASVTPASVFPHLLQRSGVRLTRLRRTRPQLCRLFQDRIAEVTSKLPSFPALLTTEEQGLFALGFYHQRVDDRRSSLEAIERRRISVQSGGQSTDLAHASADVAEEELLP